MLSFQLHLKDAVFTAVEFGPLNEVTREGDVLRVTDAEQLEDGTALLAPANCTRLSQAPDKPKRSIEAVVQSGPPPFEHFDPTTAPLEKPAAVAPQKETPEKEKDRVRHVRCKLTGMREAADNEGILLELQEEEGRVIEALAAAPLQSFLRSSGAPLHALRPFFLDKTFMVHLEQEAEQGSIVVHNLGKA
jgi:hypothetical protein